jgi:hypothetical protein
MRATTDKDGVVKNKGLAQLLWFAGLYAASLAAFTTFIYLLRWLLKG